MSRGISFTNSFSGRVNSSTALRSSGKTPTSGTKAAHSSGFGSKTHASGTHASGTKAAHSSGFGSKTHASGTKAAHSSGFKSGSTKSVRCELLGVKAYAGSKCDVQTKQPHARQCVALGLKNYTINAMCDPATMKRVGTQPGHLKTGKKQKSTGGSGKKQKKISNFYTTTTKKNTKSSSDPPVIHYASGMKPSAPPAPSGFGKPASGTKKSGRKKNENSITHSQMTKAQKRKAQRKRAKIAKMGGKKPQAAASGKKPQAAASGKKKRD